MDFLVSLYKATVKYRAPFRYVYFRYVIAPKIYKVKQLFERTITHSDFSIHMLTCHRDILIALWSLASFYRYSNVRGHLTIHDDGTLTKADRAHIKRLFPDVHIESVSDFMQFHGSSLDAYPEVKKFRKVYTKFQSKKLVDVYTLRKGRIILFLDSDLLWFQNPEEISRAVREGAQAVSYMMSNGKERVHVTFKDGTQTSDFIAECNSGVTLFHEDNFSFAELEAYLERCDYLGRKFTDQACFGTILKHLSILPRDRYFIKGELTKNTVMRHYTGPSRLKFFFYGIDRIYTDILK